MEVLVGAVHRSGLLARMLGLVTGTAQLETAEHITLPAAQAASSAVG